MRHRGNNALHLLRIVRKDLLLENLQGTSKGDLVVAEKSQLDDSEVPNIESQAVKLWHPFLLPLRWTIETAGNFFLIYDSVWNEAGIMLSRHLHNFTHGDSPPPPPVLPIEHIRFIAAEVILALQHLHSLDFVYGNLTPETVMVTYEGAHLHIHFLLFYSKLSRARLFDWIFLPTAS